MANNGTATPDTARISIGRLARELNFTPQQTRILALIALRSAEGQTITVKEIAAEIASKPMPEGKNRGSVATQLHSIRNKLKLKNSPWLIMAAGFHPARYWAVYVPPKGAEPAPAKKPQEKIQWRRYINADGLDVIAPCSARQNLPEAGSAQQNAG